MCSLTIECVLLLGSGCVGNVLGGHATRAPGLAVP